MTDGNETDHATIPDTVVDRIDVLRLTIVQHEETIRQIQQRRLAVRLRLDHVLAAKLGAHIDVLSSRLETVCTQLESKLTKIDKTIVTIEDKLRKAEALVMEITHERSELAKLVPAVPAGELPEPINRSEVDDGVDEQAGGEVGRGEADSSEESD